MTSNRRNINTPRTQITRQELTEQLHRDRPAVVKTFLELLNTPNHEEINRQAGNLLVKVHNFSQTFTRFSKQYVAPEQAATLPFAASEANEEMITQMLEGIDDVKTAFTGLTSTVNSLNSAAETLLSNIPSSNSNQWSKAIEVLQNVIKGAVTERTKEILQSQHIRGPLAWRAQRIGDGTSSTWELAYLQASQEVLNDTIKDFFDDPDKRLKDTDEYQYYAFRVYRALSLYYALKIYLETASRLENKEESWLQKAKRRLMQLLS